MIYSETAAPGEDERLIIDIADTLRRKSLPDDAIAEDLLVPVFRKGKQVCPDVAIEESRQRTADQLRALEPGIKRLRNPDEYPAGLEPELQRLKADLILQSRGTDRM